MFWNIFGYRMKSNVRDISTLFWTLAFPLFLATFFGLVFPNITSNTVTFETVNVGVYENAAYAGDPYLMESIQSAKQSKDIDLFRVTVFESKEAAEVALHNQEISGYAEVTDRVILHLAGSGFNQTIIKSFFDQYGQISSAIEDIARDNPAAIQEVSALLQKEVQYTTSTFAGRDKPDSILVYFYSLIAMTCLYGAFQGQKEIMHIQANQSQLAARQNVSPVPKLKLFGSSMLSVTLVQYLSILILLAYLVFVLRINIGDRIGMILAAAFAGCCLGISFGALVGAVVKAGEGIKIAIIISFSMILSFLSGMMQHSVKVAVEKAVPVFKYALPGNLIANTFYAIYYFNNNERFYFGMALMIGISIVFYTIVILVLRRQKYASI
ncbi:ABC transporter permease [Candidatus Saccharibacteria bacterium]|jgi:ABC-2 type transport system permease protein|nr:ABC transporter permease [Oscillospiraceae bacterium]NLA43717.1 ABC transporter permease [Candidatus Saccharibacteria bacterium]NLO61803.1 ABC transporter permease [Clostridiaceae bacterium]